MAAISTLKINSYFFMMMMVTIFGLFLLVVVTLIGIPYPLNLIIIVIFTLIFVLIQIAIATAVVRWSTKTRYLKPGENPFFEEMVKKLTKEAEIPMPKLGIVDNPTPNAFVFGLTQEGSTLAVHTGLLDKLNQQEIEAVIAHEIGHIKNRDCMYMTILSVIPLISYMGMYLMWAGRGGRGDKNAGVLVIIGLLSMLVYFITALLIKKLSRIREFYADAYSGYITKDPHSLASALTKITYGLSLAPPDKKQSDAASTFYIGDVQNAHKEMDSIKKNASKYDLDGDGVIDDQELELAMQDEAQWGAWDKLGGMFSTHPPTFKRILAIKEMEKEMDKGQIRQDNIYEKVDF
jgi:heat shock protein HtpX